VSAARFKMVVPEHVDMEEVRLIQALASWQNLGLFLAGCDNSMLKITNGVPRPVVFDGCDGGVAVGFWEFAEYIKKKGLTLI
jgi:hypothetical protein